MINPFAFALVYIPTGELILLTLIGTVIAGVIAGLASIALEEMRS